MEQEKNIQKNFCNGKELLECCIHKLNENQQKETGGNVALYPTVIIMMGNKCRNFVQYIKNTLDENWNNACFLQYLCVIKEDSQWKVFILRDGDNKKTYTWEMGNINWEMSLDNAIVRMLETEEKIFSSRTSVKLEYVLDATEEDSMEYFKLFQQTNNTMCPNELKTLYLMLDQKPGDSHVGASHRLLRNIVKDNVLTGSQTVYLLSNYLNSGQMLGDNNIWQNYRLSANLILLGGNKKGSDRVIQNLFRGFKTVSYALVTKPTDEIATISILALLHGLYTSEENKLFHEMTASEIKEKLQMDQYNGFLYIEELFNKKIKSKFPKETDWKYLPFSSCQDYKKIQGYTDVTLEMADNATFNAATAFMQKHYTEPARNFFKDNNEIIQCRKKISRILKKNFNYFEILYLSEHQDVLKEMVVSEYHFAGLSEKDSFYKRFHNLSVYKSKCIFYNYAKNIIKDELELLLESAQNFKETYIKCEKEMEQQRFVTDSKSESVEKFYSETVKEYIEQKQQHFNYIPDNYSTTFPEVFSVSNTKEELLQAVWNEYLGLIKNNIYNCNFEQELANRMNKVNENGRHKFVSEELKKRLKGSIRIKNNIEIPMVKTGCYYLVNANAEYARTLEAAGSKEYVLFDLNRTDCIEQLEIYDITKPEQLHLAGTGAGDGNYDNKESRPELPDNGTGL